MPLTGITPVPPAACIEVSRSAALTENPWFSGFFSLTGAGRSLVLRCPLPVNNIDLSGTTNDNDLSQIRVHYRDTDGTGSGTSVAVALIKTAVPTTIGGSQNTTVCSWFSSTDGTGATTTTRATKACAHDLAAGAFYHLQVSLQSSQGHNAQFLGVDFP